MFLSGRKPIKKKFEGHGVVPRARRDMKKKTPRFVVPKDADMDYKNLALIGRLMTDSGKILSRRLSGVTGKQQRDLCLAIKRAKYLGLLTVSSTRR